MKTNTFHKLVDSLDDLSNLQDRLLREQLKHKANKKHVSMRLETSFEEVRCPHCEGSAIQRWGRKNDMQRYRCKHCGKTFNSLTKTPLARLRRKGHWIDYAECLKEGLSIRKAAKHCGISDRTSFRWRHRFLQNSTKIRPEKLEGIVEADETYFARSEKGSRKLKRPARKRGVKIKKNAADTVCVLVCRDRNRNVFDSFLEKFCKNNITNALLNGIGKDALFCSDNRSTYKDFTRAYQIRHGFIDISRGEYVKKDIVHVKNAYAYHLDLKTWIGYKFHGVATRYLENYMGWFREMDEFQGKLSAEILLQRAKSVGNYKFQYLTST